MKVLVMGAGGVGGYFGARLQQAGNEVVFVARGRHLEAIRKAGLRVESALGNAALEVKATSDPAEAGLVDVVLFCVKLWDTEGAAEQIRPAIGPQTIVIPGWESPSSGPITWTIPSRPLPVPYSRIPNSSQFRRSASSCAAARSSAGRSSVGTLWSIVARVRSGLRTRRPSSRKPSNACGDVTSWTRCRST